MEPSQKRQRGDQARLRVSPPRPDAGGAAERTGNPQATSSGSGRRGWLFSLFIAVAVVLAYLPVWHAGFIWDDDVYVTNNPLLTAPDGLRRIWFSTDSPSQYFPLTYTVFRFEQALWGFHPFGYHGVNLLLHVANALLVLRLLKRLGIPGAWLAAAIFALHPVNVESVAWVTELKSVLSLFFLLLTLLAWVEFVEERQPRFWRWYGLALLLYPLALFSKTTACTLPAALLLILWLKHRPINRFRLLQVVPFLALGVGMGLLTMWWERYHIGTQGKMFALGGSERILVASHALWFYLGKLVCPLNLTFSYPKWALHPDDPLAYGWLLACLALGVAIYWGRRFFGRGVEVAALFFAATLSPLLGFIMLYTFRYSFVADHYQYVACLGPIALASAGITIGFEKMGKRAHVLKTLFCGTLLLILGVLTWRQSRMYADGETLWQTTIDRNPASWMAHYNLGNARLREGRTDEAILRYQQALAVQPDLAEAHNNLGSALLQKGLTDDAITHFQNALALQPDVASAHNNLGVALFQKQQTEEAIVQFQNALALRPDYAEAHSNLGDALFQKGLADEAIAQFQKALAVRPGLVDAQNGLARVAWRLATSPNPSLRNGVKAVELSRQTDQLTGGKNPKMAATLAAAFAESGQFPEAIVAAQRALQLAASQNNAALVAAAQLQLKSYEAGSPFRDGNPPQSATP